ncbi:hypothetical protein BC829DRAFT_394830 [Chytridium lagenaria]|nr:hypothetical protein BC829DRAFT_394830 [Chytridium lagenaria]
MSSAQKLRERHLRVGGSDSPLSHASRAGRTPKSARKVRKAPIMERIASAPSDLIISFNDSVSSVDWDGLMQRVSTALGISLNFVLMGIKVYKGEAFTDEVYDLSWNKLTAKGKFEREREKESRMNAIVGPFFLNGIFNSLHFESFFFIELILIALSFLNILFVLNNSKSYTLLFQPTQGLRDSHLQMMLQMNSWKVKSRNARMVMVDVNTRFPALDDVSSDEDEGFSNTPSRFSIGPLNARKRPRAPLDNPEPRLEPRWKLFVWSPPEWGLHLLR